MARRTAGHTPSSMAVERRPHALTIKRGNPVATFMVLVMFFTALHYKTLT